MKPRLQIEEAELVLSLPSTLVTPSCQLDYGRLGLDEAVAIALKHAAEGVYGHTHPTTQKKVYWALRKLARCLVEHNLQSVACMPGNTAALFRDWMAETQYSGGAAQQIVNFVVAILEWCFRNEPKVIAKDAFFLVRPLPRAQTKESPAKRVPASKALTQEALKRVLDACYSEIEIAEASLDYGRRLLKGFDLTSEESRTASLLRDLVLLGGGKLPTQAFVRGTGHATLKRQILELGGHRALIRLLYISQETMFPYYLAILTQTSGNPEAILELKRNCISPHPLRSDLERIVWQKRRSSDEQRAEFPTGRKWSAPSLVRRLIARNQELTKLCEPVVNDRLFLAYSAVSGVGLAHPGYMSVLLRGFIKRHHLEPFVLRDLRRSGAVAHHQAAGTIAAAQNRLNHASPATTARYTPLADRKLDHDRLIKHFQGEMVRASSLDRGSSTSSRPLDDGRTLGHAETVFGFHCKDPFAGLAVGSQKGSPCLQFFKCATCPGALIPVDDLTVVINLMSAHAALEDARQRAMREGWWPRYEVLYEPTRIALNQDILPALDTQIKAIAVAQIDAQRVPRLD